MTKKLPVMKEKHIKSFQPDANQDLWEDWASIMFAFVINKNPINQNTF